MATVSVCGPGGDAVGEGDGVEAAGDGARDGSGALAQAATTIESRTARSARKRARSIRSVSPRSVGVRGAATVAEPVARRVPQSDEMRFHGGGRGA